VRLSIAQLAKVVLAFAVACAVITPSFRCIQHGLPGVREALVADAVMVPLTWALLAFVLMKRGSHRASLIDVLLLCAVAVVLGYIVWLAAPLARRFGPRGFVPLPIEWPTVAIAAFGVPLFGVVSVALVVRLVRRGRLKPIA
jgi:hypothetical protein